MIRCPPSIKGLRSMLINARRDRREVLLELRIVSNMTRSDQNGARCIPILCKRRCPLFMQTSKCLSPRTGGYSILCKSRKCSTYQSMPVAPSAIEHRRTVGRQGNIPAVATHLSTRDHYYVFGQIAGVCPCDAHRKFHRCGQMRYSPL